jgi:hypothetical protein
MSPLIPVTRTRRMARNHTMGTHARAEP